MNKKHRTGCLTRRICTCFAAALTLVALTSGCAGKGAETQSGSVQNAVTEYRTIETAYGPLQIVAQSADRIRHTEIVEDGVTREVFHMLPEDGERELFQICFGSDVPGTPIGLLQTDAGTVTVSVVAPEYDMSAFSEKELTAYGALMDQLNVMLASVRESEQFRPYEGKPQETEPEIERQTAALTYWTVKLPESIDWEETVSGDVYRADFYGMVGDERIRLYTISLGDEAAASLLGTYTAEGMTRVLGVTPYSMSSQIAWSGDEQSRAYAVMMDTINEILPVIMESENFEAEIPE